ncbi:hypothetical protein THIOM_005255 [Candidatus Thiomargarita nelsonii]|uniref:Uncharacterized protein n=1 Tax=Candidatus Thiomargarita nelsonii TaxID=1003181 RepID=A0A176RTT7_9GAMM|nr:hypothetical protein THIOM_005255 [Candidatus Thiomargarita nelsonii]
MFSVKPSMQNFLMKSSRFLLNQRRYRSFPWFLAKEILCYMLAWLKKDNMPCQKFIIFCSPRVGSGLLSGLLNLHPDIHVDDVILSHNRVKKLFFPIRYIKGYSLAFEKPVYGFKIHPANLAYQKLDAQKFLLKLHQAGWKIIHMKRANIVRQQISLMIATQRNQWIDTVENSLKNSKYYINIEEFIKKIQRQETHLFNEKKVLEQIPHITITYEDDLLIAGQHQKTADRVFEYLGIESIPVKTQFKRTTTDKLSDFIENYEEIVSVLCQTKYAKFIDDD